MRGFSLFWGCVIALGLAVSPQSGLGQTEGGPLLIFAVLTEKPVDFDKLQAHVLVHGDVIESTLLPTESARRNPMWSKLEMCQGMKAEGIQEDSGFRIKDFRVLGASMLPMALQGVAGDCFLKKALEYAPLVD